MTDVWTDDQLSRDDFLGGQLRICQPKHGYRAGIDPVLLAASVCAQTGDTVLDLGCGVGTAMLCLGRRVPGLALTGIEVQADYAELARRNAVQNGLTAQIVTADLDHMPDSIKQYRFDHVIANPPYFDRQGGTRASDQGRETALGENLSLERWVAVAAKRTAPKGTVTFIHRAERLPDLLAAASVHLGSLEVLPLIPRPGRAARLILLRGQKQGRAEFRLHAGWVLHDGHTHPGDQENYTDATASILRGSTPLLF